MWELAFPRHVLLIEELHGRSEKDLQDFNFMYANQKFQKESVIKKQWDSKMNSMQHYIFTI